MLNFKGMRFPIDVILVCIRSYAVYPLSDRHLRRSWMSAACQSAIHQSIGGNSFPASH
jgi:putative transposase